MTTPQTTGRHVERPDTPAQFRAAYLIKSYGKKKVTVNKTTKLRAAVGAAVVALTTAGCAYATPDTSQVAISYTGGAFESQTFDKPTVPDGLRNELQAREAALLAQQTANDQLSFATGFPGGLTGYQAYLEQQARTKCYNDGRCIYVPDGVSVPAPVAGG